MYLMGGGGASGKGAVKNLLIDRGEIPEDGAVRLDPDEIKAEFPEYQEIVRAGDSRAASVVHEESSAVSKRVLGEAMDQRRDIVYDVTLGNPDKGRALIDDAKSSGYEVRLYGVTAAPEAAVERNGIRAERTGRYVPVESQLQAHKGFSEGFESYAARADRAELFDTNGREFKSIAVKEPGGKLRITRPEEYQAFERKATLNPAARGPDELYADTSRAGERDTAESKTPQPMAESEAGEPGPEPRVAESEAGEPQTQQGTTASGEDPAPGDGAGQADSSETAGFDDHEQDYLSRVDDSMSDDGADSGGYGDGGGYDAESASAEGGGAESADVSVDNGGRGAE